MKKIAWTFLLAAILSCGNSAPSSDNRVTLQFRDSTIHDYYLLAVRDHSLVVSPYLKKDIPADSLIASAENISFEKIEVVYYRSYSTPADIIFPALGGCTVGGITGCALSTGKHNPGTDDVGFTNQYTPEYIGIGALAGFITGAIAGNLLSNYDRHYFLFFNEHLVALRKHAFYEIEPDRLLKVQ